MLPLGDPWDPSDPERDTEQRHNRFAQINNGLVNRELFYLENPGCIFVVF
jgi:hypothetical protein